MQLKGFDGRTYTFHKKKDNDSPSKGHLLARTLLKQIFPLDMIVEELELPGTKERFKRNLYADFFIMRPRLIIEIHGQQHYTYTPFFHSSLQDFIESKKRDLRKKDWCDLNGFTYVELSDKEDLDEWERKIKSAIE